MATEILFFIVMALGIAIGYCLPRIVNKKKETKTAPVPAPQELPETGLEKKIMLEEAIAIIKRLSETAVSTLELKGLADEIIKTTCNILNPEFCVLLLLEEETDTLKVISSVGLDKKTAKTMRIKNGEEISGVVTKLNETKIFNQLEKEIWLYNLKYDSIYKHSLASLPLSFKNKAIGVLNVSNKKSGKPFSTTDEQILKIIAVEAAITLENSKLFQEQQKNYLDTIIALAKAIDARDPYTYYHSTNVSKYSVAIAKKINAAETEVENIERAALLHDIGKIGIKDIVLMKPEKLTKEEYEEIKKHPSKGEEIIKSLPFLKEVTIIVKHHHERYDGLGYPDGLSQENIALGARILAIADSFDTMTTRRLYRHPLSLEEAKTELFNNKGKQFDPYLVDCFLEILEKEPDIVSKN